jgi:hypothetical protein
MGDGLFQVVRILLVVSVISFLTTRQACPETSTFALESRALSFSSPDAILDSDFEVRQVHVFNQYASIELPEICVLRPLAFTGVDPISAGNALEAPDLSQLESLDYEWEAPRQEGYQWGGAIGQALLFTTVGHVFRVATEEKTRRELKGPFFDDWFKSAKSLFSSGWSDGGRDFTNYVVHPASGAVYGHIYRQNHPRDRDIGIALTRAYFAHMGKTTAFSFVASLAWEIGPYSEASIGNVGLYNTPEAQQMTWGDVVVTPLLGVWGVMLVEDLLERYVVRKVEARTRNRWIKALVRIPLTPTRSAANLMAIKRPDYRPDRQ